MKLYVDKITFAAPPRREPYALALVLTPRGCEGPLGSFSMIQHRPVRELSSSPTASPSGWLLAQHLDPEDFLVVFLQVWETSKPERVHGLLAALRTRLERSPLGQRLIRGQGIPSEGLARSGGGEVMRTVAATLVGAGDVLVTGRLMISDEWSPSIEDVTDFRGRATVSLRLEAPGSAGWSCSLCGSALDSKGVCERCGSSHELTVGPLFSPASGEVVELETPPAKGAVVTADVQGIPEGAEVLDVREDGRSVPFDRPSPWRLIVDTDVVDETFRIRNPYGEEQTITDRHEGDRVSFDDGDTWTVAAMAAAGWEMCVDDRPLVENRPTTRTPAPHFGDPLPSNFPVHGGTEPVYAPGEGPGEGGGRAAGVMPPSPWRHPRTWSEVTVGREVLFPLGGQEVEGEVVPPEGKLAGPNRAYLLPASSLSPTVPEDGVPQKDRVIDPIRVIRLKDFKIRDPEPADPYEDSDDDGRPELTLASLRVAEGAARRAEQKGEEETEEGTGS